MQNATNAKHSASRRGAPSHRAAPKREAGGLDVTAAAGCVERRAAPTCLAADLEAPNFVRRRAPGENPSWSSRNGGGYRPHAPWNTRPRCAAVLALIY